MSTPPPAWRKSSYSVNTGQCVELADTGCDVLVRDSKHPEQGHFTLAHSELAAFITGVKAGEFDHLH
jgi:DNA-binding sugar fermentation-stimulating protein